MNNNSEEKPTNSQTATVYLKPRTDIYETDSGYILEADMPGVNKTGLQITVDKQELTLVGVRPESGSPGEEVYRESEDLPYKRVFDLDVSINTAMITATIEQGVVRLTLPKAENLQPRQIAVTD